MLTCPLGSRNLPHFAKAKYLSIKCNKYVHTQEEVWEQDRLSLSIGVDKVHKLVRNLVYPKIAYLECLTLFFGANFIYHQNVYRQNWNRPQFAAFLLVNLFTSFQLTEATNMEVARYYASIYNNTLEFQHRAQVNQRLRLKLFGNVQ
eukprot:403332953